MHSNGTKVGAIADDFTGATDLASVVARSGQRVSLRIGVPSGPPADTASYEVVALKSRTSPVDDAKGEALAAYEWLKLAGAEQFFWKYCSTFDSTPEGNIGPVAEVLMAELGATQTVYCPAFPENGRTVYMGHLFVDGLPLDESPLKDHPLTPMRDSSLVRLLEPQVGAPVGLIAWPTVARGTDAIADELARLQGRGVAHVVMDAISDDDLTHAAAACSKLSLLTGGSAFAGQLAGVASGAEPRPSPTVPPVGRGAVVLSGSASEMTNAQVAAYVETGAPALQLDPRVLAETGSSSACRWLEEQDLDEAPIVYATAEPEVVRSVQADLGKDRSAALVENTLADCARTAVAAGARRIAVAGGETSGAVTSALGVDRLEVGPEIAPGVPWCYFTNQGEPYAIVLKSGNFGNATFFADALEALDRP